MKVSNGKKVLNSCFMTLGEVLYKGNVEQTPQPNDGGPDAGNQTNKEET